MRVCICFNEKRAYTEGLITSEGLRRTIWTGVPAVDGGASVELVEAQVGGGHHFGQQDDLSGVH